VGDLDRIAAMEIATTLRGYQQAGSDPAKWAPNSKDTADHSLPYIAARAMLDGDIGHDSFAPEKLSDPRVLALMRRITVVEDPAFARPKGNAPSTRITVTLDDGRRIMRQVDDMPGFPGQPMSRSEVERKFRGNVGRRWPQRRTEDILQALWALERTDDLPGLIRGLAFGT
jgi:2-methylcitrate dehydratase